MRIFAVLIAVLSVPWTVLAQSWLQFPQSVTLKDVSEDGKTLRTVYPASWPLPGYPVDLLRAGIHRGSVTLRFTVREDCSIANIQIIHSTTPEFGESAKEAVERWRFARPPGSKVERWASTDIACRFDFQLHEK